MPPPKYIDTISKPTSWGGAIELSILAKHYNTEIASVDVETGRIDRFRVEESEVENRSVSLLGLFLGLWD
jgi:ubiquitin thioesterase OTU1